MAGACTFAAGRGKVVRSRFPMFLKGEITMIPLPMEGVPGFEAWLARRWRCRWWFACRGSLACSFGLLGLRWSEVEVMRRGDLQVERGALYVRTRKRGRPRTIEAPSSLIEAAAAMRGAVAGGDDRVFVTRGGRGLVYQDIRRFVAAATQEVFGRRFSFHCFRHTAAVRVYKRTRDVLAVQRQLGHVSLRWTEAYLRSLEVVDVGGPVAFAGGHAKGLRLFVPEEVTEVLSVARGKAAAGRDEAAYGVDAAARGGGGRGPASAKEHVCQGHLMPVRFGSEEGVVSAACRLCGSVWQWKAGESVAAAKQVRAGRGGREVKAAAVEAAAEPCDHRERERRWEKGRLVEFCVRCGAFYGYVASDELEGQTRLW